MKLSRPAAVLTAVIAISGGAAFAVNAATADTSPITLCSNAKTSAVTIPSSNGSCAKGTTPFEVASDADVQALAAEVETSKSDLQAVRAVNTQQDTDIGALKTQNSNQAAAIASQAAAIESLQKKVQALTPPEIKLTGYPVSSAEWGAKVTGTGLKPGATVVLHWYGGGGSTPFGTTVREDGTFDWESTLNCGFDPVYVTSLAPDGSTVTSNRISPEPGCP